MPISATSMLIAAGHPTLMADSLWMVCRLAGLGQTSWLGVGLMVTSDSRTPASLIAHQTQ